MDDSHPTLIDLLINEISRTLPFELRGLFVAFAWSSLPRIAGLVRRTRQLTVIVVSEKQYSELRHESENAKCKSRLRCQIWVRLERKPLLCCLDGSTL